MKYITLTLMLVITFELCAQVGIGTTTPHASAIVELKSSTQGFLPPRLSNLQLKTVDNPSTGLMVYCNDCCYDKKAIMFKSPAQWQALGGTCTPCDSTIELFKLQNLNSASNIVGQTDATTNTVTYAANTTPFAYYMSLDKTTGKVFVSQNKPANRISRYSSLESFLFNENAEMVFGKPNFTNNSNPSSATVNNLKDPKGTQMDKYGNLWVVDAVHNRVLKYNNAASLSTQPDANLVLGQPNFTTETAVNNSASGLSSPFQLVIDEDNATLWVSNYNKVFGYKNYNSITNNGHPADVVLGADNFSQVGGGNSQTRFSNIKGLALIDGDLYISDGNNHRIMRYNNVDSKTNGAAADEVYFQTNFTNKTSGSSSSKISKPFLISSDEKGNLYISEDGNHRISVIENIKNKDRTAVSNHTFGGGAGTTANTLRNPRGVSLFEFNGQKVIAIADKSNHRVVVYGPDKLEINEGVASNNLGILSGVAVIPTDNITFSIESQPSQGTVSVDPSTGVLSYDASTITVNEDTPIIFQYKITNEGGCNIIIEQSILIKNL